MKRLTSQVALTIIFGHTVIVFLVLFSPLYGVEFRDAISLLTVITPILSAYAASSVRYYFQPQGEAMLNAARPSKTARIIALAVPLILIIAICFVFLAYALDLWNATLEETRIAICVVEATFGVMLGTVSKSLFPNHSSKAKKR